MYRKTTSCAFALTLLAPLAAFAAEPDVLKDAVDPYNIAKERTRFFALVGVDNELDASEFEAAASKTDGWVRKFDKWATLATFDRAKDGKIDISEAQDYRGALRRAVLAQYDADKNSKLEGAERVAANKDLAAGKAPKLDAPAVIAAAPAPAPGNRRFGGEGRGRGREEFIRRADTDGDGQVSDAERLAFGESQRQEFNQRIIAQGDKDGDGKLSDSERVTLDPRMQMMLKLQDLGLPHFDNDGDGKLDATEQQSVLAFGKKLETVGLEWRLGIADLNKDGQVTSDEEQAVQQKIQAAAFNLLPKAQSWADADGDGQASQEEWRALAIKSAGNLEGKLKDWTKTYDSDGNGKLSEPERDNLIAGVRQHFEGIYRGQDSNNDGQLDVTETTAFLEAIATDFGVKPSRLQ